MSNHTKIPSRLAERAVEQRVALLLNRYWRDAALLWASDGSRVYRIQHEGQAAVLKVFVPMEIGRGRLEPVQDTFDRYEREREAAEAFASSPYGLPVLESGVRARTPFLVFPFVEGSTLEREIDFGELHPRRAVEILCMLAEAVRDLHDRGFVHADLKPGNVLLDGSRLFLIDFGCVKRIGAETSAAEPVYFSIGYTPLECLTDGYVPQASTDVFSLGMIAQEMLGAGNPFQEWYDLNGDDSLDSYANYVDFLSAERVPSLGESASFGPELVAAVDGACALHPVERPQDVEAILRALRTALRAAEAA